MNTIHKYSIPISDIPYSLPLPMGAEVLHVAPVPGTPNAIWMWCRLNPDLPKVNRTFHTFGTGHRIGIDLIYRGTAVVDMDDLFFVWHLFETP